MSWKVNFYRKLPEDLHLPSNTLSLFTTFCTVCLLTWLILAEYGEYTTVRYHDEILLDVHQEDQLKIAFDMTFPSLPCRYLSMDLQDHMGQMFINQTRHIQHYRTGTNQEKIITTLDRLDPPLPPTFETAEMDGEYKAIQLTSQNFNTVLKEYDLVLGTLLKI